MRKLTSIIMAMAVVCIFTVGQSLAVPTLSGADYWTYTDFTTGGSGNSNFELTANGTPDHAFGLYSQDDPTNVLEIFAISADPSTWTTAVFFSADGTKAGLSETTIDTELDKIFGFYFEAKDKTRYYTDASLNLGGVEMISIEYDSTSKHMKATLDFSDSIVDGDDVRPVPEPSTMLLMGLGLLGLAGYSRKRFANKS